MDRAELIKQLDELAEMTPPICDLDKPYKTEIMGKSVTVYCKPFEQFQMLVKQAADALASEGPKGCIGKNGPPGMCPNCGYETKGFSWDWDTDVSTCLTCGWSNGDVKSAPPIDLNPTDPGLKGPITDEISIGQWISIKERPPIDETKDYQKKWEENPEFLVMIKDGVVPTCLYFDGVDWYANDGESFTYNVTHWMPLPEPPKEDTK